VGVRKHLPIGPRRPDWRIGGERTTP
jgi:hypothetical protein